jgi:general secretion pathway protein M
MIHAQSISKFFAQPHASSALGYVAILLCCSVIVWLALASLADNYAEFSAASIRLDAIEGRRTPVENVGGPSGPAVSGSPFLEGPTVTLAGADLQQRVVAAVQKVGGNVLSSQVDLQGAQSKQGYVSLTTTCEIEQAVLQPLLYDIEAGMPFLFIDQLVVQAPQSSGGTEGQRMRVQIDVSGQWQVAK